jgi:hypothetical protein
MTAVHRMFQFFGTCQIRLKYFKKSQKGDGSWINAGFKEPKLDYISVKVIKLFL